MRWLERDMWKAGIAIAGMLLLLVLMVWVPVSAAGTQETASGLATLVTVTVQTTPTVDATVIAWNKEKLNGEVAQQQHTWENWLWSNAATVSSTLVIVLGALFGLWRWLGDRRSEREKRAEERFQSAVTGLGDEKEGARIGAAILLRTFLHPGYEQFYTQTFDLAVANLRLPSIPNPPENPNTPLPLTTLRQALIVVFKEAFPLARSQNKGSFQSLEASRIQLDNAYLHGADLEQAWMPQASLRRVNLRRANLRLAYLAEADFREANLGRAKFSGADLVVADLSRTNLSSANFTGANLSGVDFSGADLSWTILIDADLSRTSLNDALSLEAADLRGVKGQTREQLAICKVKGAIIDEDFMTSSSQSPVSPPPPSQSNDPQAQSAPPAQGSTPTSDTGGSSAASSKPGPES